MIATKVPGRRSGYFCDADLLCEPGTISSFRCSPALTAASLDEKPEHLFFSLLAASQQPSIGLNVALVRGPRISQCHSSPLPNGYTNGCPVLGMCPMVILPCRELPTISFEIRSGQRTSAPQTVCHSNRVTQNRVLTTSCPFDSLNPYGQDRRHIRKAGRAAKAQATSNSVPPQRTTCS